MKKLLTLAVLMLIGFSPLYSQWSSDPNVNTKVSDPSGQQTLPKIAKTSDGGCYIVWFDHRASNYDVYLQKLNSAGVPQFAADGLLISSNSQNSSLVNYDMIADDSNNAIIVFTDIRSGEVNPFAYKISPSGTFLWGANGVTLTDSAGTFQPNPKVVQTSDGNYVIAWIWATNPQKIAMQMLNRGGVKQWGSGPIKLAGGAGETFTYPALVPSDAGSVIMMWSKYTGSFISPGNYRLFTQKFNSSGSPVWNGTQDTVYHLGNVNGFYVPNIYSDGNNGALYCWQDDRNSTNLQSSFVQHFNSAGVPQFPVNGSEGSTEGAMNKFSPNVAYSSSTNETFLFWKETNSLQSMQGIYGQKFNASGVRQWTDNGKVFLPIGGTEVVTGLSTSLDTNIFVYYNMNLGSSTNNITAFKTGPSGAMHWGGIITPASSSSGKGSLVGVVTGNGMSIVSWYDNRLDGGGIYAQNINQNGTFGVPTGIIGSNSNPDEFSLSQNYPNPFNPETVIGFALPQTSDILFTVYNSLGQKVYSLTQRGVSAGSHQLSWNGAGYPSGVYFYKLETNGFSETKKMLLIK
ncbi:MAG: T9SS type A sorting domain-containing protein [Ignavibacteriae bacterium]|nr:T9SS type A sorting domain-containing protein [Ignavibacteriota bacterium]